MNWYKIGAYIWTGCAASWLVIGITFGMIEAYLTGIGCIAMAAIFNELEL